MNTSRVLGANPYAGRADYTFWRRAMAGRETQDVDPVVGAPFRINNQDLVATAGSCFAQHIARTLVHRGFAYLVTERSPSGQDDDAGGYGVFPARFGNIYTARQLLQLFRRVYGIFDTWDTAWLRKDGAYIDPFRPRVVEEGFATLDALQADLEMHFAAVREMFETCDVFIFTLGLTEAWVSRRDGAVFPLVPGVVATSPDPADYAFHNFTVSEIEADMLAFIDGLRMVNPGVRIILTVSPVALVATYEDHHVLVSTTYSKAVLRVVAGTVSQAREKVAYFPSYEIITGPHGGRAMYEEDLREVRPQSVEHVMSLFAKHYLSQMDEAPRENKSTPRVSTLPSKEVEVISKSSVAATLSAKREAQEREFLEVQAVICDEEALDPVS
jgi:hypothetical protein